MDEEQKDLLIELVRVERRRLNWLKYEYAYDSKDQAKISKEISLCDSTLMSLIDGL
jgi:hypothetical protein|tara:strand:- start:178 stop:345 length:168 start_codon:yes stop_codon:yes gene_type:complete